MFKKNCNSCGKKIDRKFRFCPWCGKPTKPISQEDYGMLGFDDEIRNQEVSNPLSIFGGSLGGVFNQLTKQLTKELKNLDSGEGRPQGIEIRFSTGRPMQGTLKQESRKDLDSSEPVSGEELERRRNLPVEIAESKIRRLPEGIVYEIDTPGVKTKQDVSILRMENSLEVRAYSRDKCYIKTIPIQVNVVKYGVKGNKVFVQIKS